MGRQLNPHAARHAHCTILEESGWSVFEIMNQMGHASATTTQRYVHSSVGKREKLMAGVRIGSGS